MLCGTDNIPKNIPTSHIMDGVIALKCNLIPSNIKNFFFYGLPNEPKSDILLF